MIKIEEGESLKINVNIVKINKNVIIPKYATKGSAAMDLHACIEKEMILNPMERVVIPTGIAIEIPSNDYVALIFARSGLSIKHGITLSNAVGVIDSDYRGEICVGLCNISNSPYTILPKDRIAQLAIMPVANVTFNEVDSLDETQRANGRFGSTGK